MFCHSFFQAEMADSTVERAVKREVNESVSAGNAGALTCLSFVVGGLTSILSGYIGMMVETRNPKLETRTPISETQNPDSETRIPKPGT